MLIRLGKSVEQFSVALKSDLDLTEEECLFVENHMLMLEMGYTQWKRRRRIVPSKAEEQRSC